MVTSPLPAVYRLTYADWLRYPDDGRLYEILEGELYVTPQPSIEHQRISRELEFLLLAYLREGNKGEMLNAPVGVRLSDEDVLEPDLLVVLREHADLIGTQVIDGAPDLIVEILSPGTVRRDLGPKRAKYEEAGVPEYWVVDPAAATIEVQVLHEGKYARHSLVHRGATLRSPLFPGFEIAADQVFVKA